MRKIVCLIVSVSFITCICLGCSSSVNSGKESGALANEHDTAMSAGESEGDTPEEVQAKLDALGAVPDYNQTRNGSDIILETSVSGADAIDLSECAKDGNSLYSRQNEMVLERYPLAANHYIVKVQAGTIVFFQTEDLDTKELTLTLPDDRDIWYRLPADLDSFSDDIIQFEFYDEKDELVGFHEVRIERSPFHKELIEFQYR